MISARPRISIKVTFLKHFALEVWVSIHLGFVPDLHIFKYITGVKSECSGETARMCRLALAFAIPLLRDTSSPFSSGLAYEPITRA